MDPIEVYLTCDGRPVRGEVWAQPVGGRVEVTFKEPMRLPVVVPGRDFVLMSSAETFDLYTGKHVPWDYIEQEGKVVITTKLNISLTNDSLAMLRKCLQ